nr:MAG TPA: hypothetical protein [Caudoviricetes sp.]
MIGRKRIDRRTEAARHRRRHRSVPTSQSARRPRGL